MANVCQARGAMDIHTNESRRGMLERFSSMHSHANTQLNTLWPDSVGHLQLDLRGR